MKSFEERLLGRLYCFCGGGDDPSGSGDEPGRQLGGADERASRDRADTAEATYSGGDTGGSTHPGRPGGESGERGDRSDRGDGNDRDDRGGDADSRDRNQIAEKANVPVDTIVGSGPDGSRAVTDKDGNPVTSSRSVSEAAREQGVSESEIRDRINSATSELQQAEEAREYSFDDADDPTIPVSEPVYSFDPTDEPGDFMGGADEARALAPSGSVYSFEDPLVSEDFVESIRSMATSPETLAREQEILEQTQRNIEELTGSRLPDQTSYAVDPSINLLEPQDIERTLYGTTLATATEPARDEYFDENIRDPASVPISEQDYLNLQRGRDIIEGAEIEQIGMPPTVSDDFDPGFFDDDTGDTGFDRTPLGGTEIRFGDVDPSEFEETFVSQDRVDVGVPVSTLPEGSYQIDPETNTVSLNEEGRSYMDALAKGYENEENEFGIDRQEIESLMQQGAVVGAPMVQVPTSIAGQDGSIEGSQARAGEGEDESGLAGGMGGKGRLGDSAQQATAEETPGVINIELFDSKILDDGTVVLSGGIVKKDEEAQPGILAPAEGEEVARADADAEGLGLLPDEGGIGLLPGDTGLIGTDSGIIGQSGSRGINPFTEGGDDGEGDETVRVSGPGESEEGEGPGTGDGVGTGTPPPVDLTDDGGDDGFEVAEPAPVDPYEFGDGTYDPLLDFEYRQPQITSPFDFARDFGSYTLSPEIEQAFQDLTERRMDAGFEPAALYEPEFLEQIGIMTPERQAEPGIASLIGSRFPQITPVEDRYPFASTPEDYAQSLVDAMRDSS